VDVVSYPTLLGRLDDGVHTRNPGGIDRSRRHFTSPAFAKVSIFPTLFGYLILARTFLDLSHGEGILGYLVHLQAYK
jgi:hypothetical protein